MSLSVLIAVLIVGCSGTGPPPEGIVQFAGGENVRSGSIEFRSLSGANQYAGRIAGDGTFQLQAADGTPSLPLGKYEVVVVQIVLTEDLAAVAHEHGGTVPRRYADYYTSGLRFENQSARVGPIKITLDRSN